MKSELILLENMKLVGKNENGRKTFFDAYKTSGGDEEYASPMEVTLQALAACTALDTISIIRKKRKTIKSFKVYSDAVQSDVYPKVFKKIHMLFELVSDDAQIEDLERAIELSQEKYCSISAMLKAAGVVITWASILKDD